MPDKPLSRKHGIMSIEEALERMAEIEGFNPREFYTDGKPDFSKILNKRKLDMIKSLVIDNEHKVISFKIRNDFSGYVYLIRSASGYIKIGQTENMEKRFSQLDKSNPEPISIYYSKLVRNRVEVERILHKEFAAQRVKGEWFRLSEEDLEKAQGIIEADCDVG